jgi:putative membrane-bound dehydrogenase-like protein
VGASRCRAAAPASAPLPPSEAAGHMTLPPGFSATLFAGEPDVVQPIAFRFDDRGRVWVAECLSYPQWDKTGGKVGPDRIVILEDTTGSGHFDRKTVFADNLVNLTGLELGFGGVYVCSSPNLLFIPVDDINGEAPRPAGPAQVMLDGWHVDPGQHNIFNQLTWGPDGWLWGLNGNSAPSHVGVPGTPAAQRTYLDGGVWRFHPTRHTFEIVAQGTVNPWGLDFNDFGQAFITNCVINHLFYIVPGGHYERGNGHVDSWQYAYGLIPHCADHYHFVGQWTDVRKDPSQSSDAGGGHAHVGAMVYLGDNWPDSYRGNIFMCNLHGSRVNNDLLEPLGSGYVGKHGKDFLIANDPWFRGIHLAYGPDGGVYVCDWCDTGECHNRITVDRTNGRLYKVTYGTPKPVKVDLARETDAELVALQLRKNDWFVRHARRVLQERFVAGKLDAGTRPALLKLLRQSPDVTRQLRAMWALHATGGLDEAETRRLLTSPEPYVRNWAVRLSLDDDAPGEALVEALPALAKVDPSPVVRLALASGMQRLKPAQCWAIAEGLLSHSEDAADANLPLMDWYGVEPLVEADAGKAAILAGVSQIPLVRQYIARRIASPQGADLAPLVRLLAGQKSDAVRLDVMHGMTQAFEGRRQVAQPDGWDAVYAALSGSGDAALRDAAAKVAVTFGNPAAFAHLRGAAADATRPAVERIAALELLVQARDPKTTPLLRAAVSDPALRSAAMKALAESGDADAPQTILKDYAHFTDDQKRDAVTALASRPAYALALLDAVDRGTVPRNDLTGYALRQIDGLNDRAVTQKLHQVWGVYRPAAADKAATIKKLKAELRPEVLRSANLPAGRALFTRTCAPCHTLFDAGGNVGPNLTGSQRSSLDFLLDNIVDPSAIVAKDYLMSTVHTKDGQVLDGIIVSEDANVLTLRTPAGDTRVPRDEVVKQKTSNASMMPEGLLEALKPDERRDLIGYLQSPVQVPATSQKQ